jgi:transcriptional regulator GlxA family with amidase domain
MKSGLDQVADWTALARRAQFRPAIMAALSGVSLRQLERYFALRFGTSPSRWVRGVRCTLARDYISQGWTDKAVVSELNFVDTSHLCHEFKRIYRTSPQTFAPSVLSHK